jgi:anti-sigma regulatory factor (Ser/Thr protein kinase)
MKEIALHILDVAENCITAEADHVVISVKQEREPGVLWIEIEDNGRGMTAEQTHMITDPFHTTRTTRRVGLGIPLIKQHAELTGGELEVSSEQGNGTRVKASFVMDHPDRQPLGDLEGCWILLAGANPAIEWELKCATEMGEFSISTSEIRSGLEVEEIRGSELTRLLKRMIRNNMEAIGMVSN